MASNIASMRQFWKNFNLPQLQQDLDQTATDLAGRQDSSDLSRRKLVEQSKEFKKTCSEEIRKAVVPLLRSFQLEIDALSKRSKAGETDFLNLYKKLSELPDPVAALVEVENYKKKAQRVNDVETENAKLRDTLAEYNKEFAEVKNQEITIKNLRERVRELENASEERAQQIMHDKNQILEKQFADKEKQLQETQLLVATKLGETEQIAANLKAALYTSQTELFDLKSKYDEEMAAKQSELDMLMNDVERAAHRSEMLEKETEKLKNQLEETSGDKPKQTMEQAIDVISRSSLEMELTSKEKEISQLVEDVQHLQASLSKLRASSATGIANVERELAEKTKLCEELQSAINERSDYNQIKREMNILKSTEFSTLLQKEGEGSSMFTNGNSHLEAKSLEVLLLEKNRAQQSENSILRAANAQMKERCETYESQLTELTTSSQQQQLLIQQLEHDLSQIQCNTAAARSEADGAPNPVHSGMSSELMADAVQNVSETNDLKTSSASTNNDNSLLTIVTSQRERFRLKTQELEAENYMQQQTVQRLQNEIDEMRSDNVKLYEKIKFLQSYPNSKNEGNLQTDVTAKRYHSQYEDNLDPFSSFNKKEKQRKYLNLNPYDKVTLNAGKFILGSKRVRTGFVLYMMLVHMLLYVVLYKYAYTEDCMRHIGELCNQKFGNAMIPNNNKV